MKARTSPGGAGSLVAIVALAASVLTVPQAVSAQVADDPVVTIVADQSSKVFGAYTDVSFTLTRTGSTTDALTVTVTLDQKDFTLDQERQFLKSTSNLSRQVTFAAGEAEEELTIGWADFSVSTGEEIASGKLTATVVDGSGYDVGMSSEAEVSIVVALTVGFDKDEYTVPETESKLTVKLVARTGEGADKPIVPSEYSVSTAAGGATADDDYVGRSVVVEIPASSYVADGTRFRAEVPVDITILSDDVDEGNEKFEVELTITSGLAPEYRNLVKEGGLKCGNNECQSQVTITDYNDRAGVTVSESSLAVREGNPTGRSYTVVLNSEPTADVEVTVAAQPSAGVTLVTTTLNFTPVNWDTPQTVKVTGRSDVDAANDSVTLTHSVSSTDPKYDVLNPAVVSVTVVDDDRTNSCPAGYHWCTALTIGSLDDGSSTLYGFAPEIADGDLADTIIDDGEGTTWTVTQIINTVRPPGSPFNHLVTIALGEYLPDGSVFYLDEEMLIADEDSENHLLPQYVWEAPDGLAWNQKHRESVTVGVKLADDSEARLASMALDYRGLTDPMDMNSEGDIAITLHPETAIKDPLGFFEDSFIYTASVANDVDQITALVTTIDIEATYAFSVGTPAMRNSKAVRNIDLSPGENVIEVEVTAKDGSTTKTYQVTLTREELPTLSFSADSYTVNEQSGSAVLTVNKSGDTSSQVTVDYRTADASAVVGADYSSKTGTLTFAPSETSKTITVQILNDNIYEPLSENFSVELHSPSLATLTTPHSADVTIRDNEQQPTASMDAQSVGEDDGTMTLTLQLSHPSSADISYSTPQDGSDVGGTATSGDDYLDFFGGSDAVITVPAEDLSATFEITIVDDGVTESDETIEIGWRKSSGSDATPARIDFVGTITGGGTGTGTGTGTGGGSSSSGGSGGGGGGDFDVGVATFVVANGWSPADVGVASVLAARTPGAVVVYTAGDELSEATRVLLRQALPAEVIIVGGNAAVSRDVRTQIDAATAGSSISRLAGADRVETAAVTARRILGTPSGAGRVTVVVANGWSSPDIGVAAALAARSGRAAVVYTRAGTLPEASAALLRDYEVARVVLVGGIAAISSEVQDAIAAARLRRAMPASRGCRASTASTPPRRQHGVCWATLLGRPRV